MKFTREGQTTNKTRHFQMPDTDFSILRIKLIKT